MLTIFNCLNVKSQIFEEHVDTSKDDKLSETKFINGEYLLLENKLRGTQLENNPSKSFNYYVFVKK